MIAGSISFLFNFYYVRIKNESNPKLGMKYWTYVYAFISSVLLTVFYGSNITIQSTDISDTLCGIHVGFYLSDAITMYQLNMMDFFFHHVVAAPVTIIDHYLSSTSWHSFRFCMVEASAILVGLRYLYLKKFGKMPNYLSSIIILGYFTFRLLLPILTILFVTLPSFFTRPFSIVLYYLITESLYTVVSASWFIKLIS